MRLLRRVSSEKPAGQCPVLRSFGGLALGNPLKEHLRWPALAQDIALITIPNSPINGLGEVCAAYGITEPELRDIISVPYFQQLLDSSMRELQKQGSKAGLRYRAMILAESLAEMLYRRANSGQMKDQDALKLLDSLLKASGVEKDAAGTQVNVQNNIALPFPQGVKKVANLIPVE